MVCFREHATRYREIEKRAHDLVERAVQARRQAEDERSEALRQASQALQERNRWRGMYRAVLRLHEVGYDGRCACGEDPCPEREAAHEADLHVDRRET